MTEAVAKRYDLAEVQRGLTAVAYANGNTHKAHRDLAEAGIAIAQKTLWNWAFDTHKQEYEGLRREILPIVGAQVADEHMALARKQLGLANQLADELTSETHKLEAKDKATAMRNADVGSGIHTEKARDLAGDFETPAKPRGVDQIIRALEAKGLQFGRQIEGVAEEE